MNAEMLRLRNALEQNNIVWVDGSDAPDYYCTHFLCGNREWCVSSGRGISECQSNLLELTVIGINGSKPITNITAADVMAMVLVYA